MQEIAAQTNQSIQQLIELFIRDYKDEQQSIKNADQSYAEYLHSGESYSLEQMRIIDFLEQDLPTIVSVTRRAQLCENAVLFGGVDNVFDKEYRVHGSGSQETGLNAVLGVEITF